MNCTWKDIGDCHRPGWATAKCQRCGTVAKLPHENRESVRSECTGNPLSHEYGHWITIVLGVFFITTNRYLWLKRKLGFNPSCNCGQREQSLNTLGAHLHTAVSRIRQSVSGVGQKLLAVYRNLRWG